MRDEVFRPDSSNVDECAYNFDTEILTVTFKGGRKYQYSGIIAPMWSQLKNSVSVGKFINQFVKDLYPTKQL